MKRYLVELVGDTADLEEFPRTFPDGDIHAIAEGTNVFLTGPVFDSIEGPDKILLAAEEVLDEMTGVILLFWPGLRRPATGAVCIEDESGNRIRHIFASIHESVRLKDDIEASVNGAAPIMARPTEGQRLLAASRLATHGQAALMIWADPNRTWPRLYRILEELEAELKDSVDKSGLCQKGDRNRFTWSANSAEVAGKDSRHRAGKFDPPTHPMSLQEASSFIGLLIQKTLNKVAQRAS